jgi:hypothetical protein
VWNVRLTLTGHSIFFICRVRIKPLTNHVHSPFEAEMDYGTATLLDEMESLTVKENDVPLVRHVTLEPESEYKAPSRPSFDHLESEYKAPSRPSFDHLHVGSQDLMFHLHGDSPEDGSGRPPKMSLDSMCSTGTLNRHRGSAPFANTHAPPQSYDFVETYVFETTVSGCRLFVSHNIACLFVCLFQAAHEARHRMGLASSEGKRLGKLLQVQ